MDLLGFHCSKKKATHVINILFERATTNDIQQYQ